jgi:hypothetical protein
VYDAPESGLGDIVADNSNDDILSQFQEFLAAKQQQEKADSESEDFDVEIWDKDGRGVRTKRSHAKPFLQSLGLDVDPEPSKESDDDKPDSKKKSAPVRTATSTAATGTARKYFKKS